MSEVPLYHMLCLTELDVPGLRYTRVNIGAGKSPQGSPVCCGRIRLRQRTFGAGGLGLEGCLAHKTPPPP